MVTLIASELPSKDESECQFRTRTSHGKAGRMKKKAFTPEQIIGKLREAYVPLSQGHKVGEVSDVGFMNQTDDLHLMVASNSEDTCLVH